jgi:hypothetical protein
MYKALNCKQRDVMIQCLLLADHHPNEWEWGSEIFKTNPGQFITSLDSLASSCSKEVSVQSVRTALLKLEKWNFLTNKSTKTGRLITIVNWETYQLCTDSTTKGTNKALTKNQQSSNKELTANKNDKNVKNEKKVKNSFIFAEHSFEVPAGANAEIWSCLMDSYGERLDGANIATVHKLGVNLSSDIYSAVNVPAEIKRAAIWEDSNSRKKTRNGISKFLTGWMDRSQNKGGTPGYINRQTTKGESTQQKQLDTIKNFSMKDFGG